MKVRYKHSVEPVYTDGRDIDLDVALLKGEAADQQTGGSPDEHLKTMVQPWHELPQPQRNDPTYYDRPLLQEPVWRWAIPLYYFVGGVTGASLVLGAAAQLKRSPKLKRLIRRCRWIGFIGACISGGLLIWDLGRPGRFLNMLRVFRPTSPMNMGAWILSGAGAASSATVLLSGRGGLLGKLGDGCGYAAGIFGMGLATYTGVLISNSAIPLWQECRRTLPVSFGASAIAATGSVFEFFAQNEDERRVTKMFGMTGQAVELAASYALEKHASVVPRVARPLKRGLTGVMWRAAALLGASSVVVGMLPNKSRNKQIASGVLGCLGSLLMRFTIEHAGTVSARDARASFHHQRAGLGAAEVTPSR